jgi:hypothetical protein
MQKNRIDIFLNQDPTPDLLQIATDIGFGCFEVTGV